MVQRIGTQRRKTRHKLKKGLRKRGKVSLATYFQSFKPGEKVVLTAEPAVQKGMYFPRHYGKSGIVKGKRGKCYEVAVKEANKVKTLVVHPVHLKRIR